MDAHGPEAEAVEFFESAIAAGDFQLRGIYQNALAGRARRLAGMKGAA